MVPPIRTQKDDKAIAFAKTLEHVPWCDDYEKMVSGMLYSCMAPELVASRHRARRLAQKFNTYVPGDDESADDVANKRVGMIKELFGAIGKDVYVEPSLQVDYGCNITIGDRFYANFNLITATHETALQSRRDNIEYAEPITIGDDCWIGANVTVLPGVNIGKGCTIGAGALVNRDIPDYSVAVGVPAKVVKKVEPLA
ncbi:uncharacterized protein N0V96_009788 [Colletotrichum fioriniae]|uniref:uncharacterized protein n=1 Tax=Colletotrichum fioriniae TaxID=710243 RepID=UPI0032DAC6CC|nr:hypothetical protein N0V96_009788 [Colletotrichum fioriniae]